MMCIYGDDVTSQFGEIHNSIYKCDWPKYPLRIQKLIPMMLIVAEKPVYIQGYMNIRCNRELIKKVPNANNLTIFYGNEFLTQHIFSLQIINAGLSYFMVFRTFEN